MTSRELLEHIKNAPSFKGGDTRYTRVSNSATQYDADIKQIEKNLEVLEILKKYINLGFLSATFTDHQHWITGGFITKEDYDKIKEWLDNEERL